MLKINGNIGIRKNIGIAFLFLSILVYGLYANTYISSFSTFNTTKQSAHKIADLQTTLFVSCDGLNNTSNQESRLVNTNQINTLSQNNLTSSPLLGVKIATLIHIVSYTTFLYYTWNCDVIFQNTDIIFPFQYFW